MGKVAHRQAAQVQVALEEVQSDVLSFVSTSAPELLAFVQDYLEEKRSLFGLILSDGHVHGEPVPTGYEDEGTYW